MAGGLFSILKGLVARFKGGAKKAENTTTDSPEVVAEALRKFINNIIKQLVLDIVANLSASPSQGGTPVDTGWARANWIPNIEQPAAPIRGGRDSAGRFTKADAANIGSAQSAQSQGVAKVIAFNGGQTIYISNNVPYILRLNDGHSQQAPKGFVQAAIVRAIKRIG